MPAQLFPILDLGAQAQDAQMNQLKMQQSMHQQAIQDTQLQLQMAQQATEQHLAPIRAQVLQQELANSQTTGQAALQAMTQAQAMAPTQLAQGQANLAATQQDTQSRALADAIAQKSDQRANAKSILDQSLGDLQLKLGQSSLDDNAMKVGIQKASFATVLTELPGAIRNVVAPTVANMFSPEVMAHILSAPEPAPQGTGQDGFYIQNLTSNDAAERDKLLKEVQKPISGMDGMINPDLAKQRQADLQRLQDITAKAFSQWKANTSNPLPLPASADKLIKGKTYLIQNPQNPRQQTTKAFTGLDKSGQPIWSEP